VYAMLSGAPPHRSESLEGNHWWKAHLEDVKKGACEAVIHVATEWATDESLVFQIRMTQSSRTLFVPVRKPRGYFYVLIDWDESLVGTGPVEGYTVVFEVAFYSKDALDVADIAQLSKKYDVSRLLAVVADAVRECGWFEG